ncbi:MAG TPA: ArsA family ATPase [Chloroflexota bacterium]
MPSSPIADARFLFFGGKGGVGKTTCAAAAALALSSEFRVQSSELSVLALSLDPAHSLRDVLGENSELKTQNSKLQLRELDAKSAFREFMDQHRLELRTIADRGTYFDDEDIEGFLDLSLPGLDEIMGLLELGRLAQAEQPPRIIVDLPPTGHALRLFDVSTGFDDLVEALELMQDKHRFAVSSLTRRYVADAVDGFLDELQASCHAAKDALLAAGQSAFVLVARPEPMVLAETARYARRLAELGASPAALVLNVTDAPPPLPEEVRDLPLATVPNLPEPPIGCEGLRPVAAALAGLLGSSAGILPAKHPARAKKNPHPSRLPGGKGIGPLLEQPRRLMIFGGKGGVGKTTLAAATALALARRDAARSVVVVSIDPAHSLGDSLEQPLDDEPRLVDGLPNLLAIELQPERHWRELKEHWQAEGGELFQGLPGGGRLDPVYDRQITQRLSQIQPTGLDEIAAATSVMDLLEQDPNRLVVIDSAPTGHLLRFLESPALVLGWAKELMHLLLKYRLATRLKQLSGDLLELSRKTRHLEALLRDAERCEVVVVTLPEAPVVAETQRLIERVRELGVPARWVVVNQAAGGRRQAAVVARLQKEHRELRFLQVSRREQPVQGLKALEALAA